METIPCSVLVLTRNAAATLERCLHNLAPFGEILVHDANSEDETVAIARRYGARILKQYETEEKSVRVKDFTAIRLKQRADAAYDWVLYLDADERLSDELVREIGEILKTAHEKVIVKVPRLPEVEGRVIPHGAFWPEIVARVHHRRGGCTLRPGKTVHEKYVYDASFTVVCTHAPLIAPFEPLAELLRKDDRYIVLEVNRWHRDRCPWSHYLRWHLLRTPILLVYIALRILWCRMRHRPGDCLPLRYEGRVLRYHAKLLLACSRFMFFQRWRMRPSRRE